jgi:hypothetical protein
VRTAAGAAALVGFHCIGQFGLGQDMRHTFRMIGIEELQGAPTVRRTRLDSLRTPPLHHGVNLPGAPQLRRRASAVLENPQSSRSGTLLPRR